MTSQFSMKLNIHQLLHVSHYSGKQRSGSVKNSLWSFEHIATRDLFFLFCRCCFSRESTFHISWFLWTSFSAVKTIILYLCVVFVQLCFCMFSRGVDLPLVCVFLPVGQSVESNSWHYGCSHGRCTCHCGLLVLLYRHLGEQDYCCLLCIKNNSDSSLFEWEG